MLVCHSPCPHCYNTEKLPKAFFFFTLLSTLLLRHVRIHSGGILSLVVLIQFSQFLQELFCISFLHPHLYNSQLMYSGWPFAAKAKQTFPSILIPSQSVSLFLLVAFSLSPFFHSIPARFIFLSLFFTYTLVSNTEYSTGCF